MCVLEWRAYLASMTKSTWSGALAVAVCGLWIAGCDDEPGAPPPEADPRPAAEPEADPSPAAEGIPTPAGQLMRGHFVRAIDARQALIRADLDRARADMAWLAAHGEADTLPEALRPRLAAMQSEAARFADATTLTEAGTAFARTLVRCGECHAASDGGPAIATPPLPEGDTVASHMQRHQWAADRMFEGLVTADPERFLLGTEALTEVPLHADQLPGSQAQPPQRLQALTNHVHDLAEEAQEVSTEDQRAGLYGRYLATCGACHRLLEGGPEASPAP